VTEARVTTIAVDKNGRASGVNYLRNGQEYFQPADVVLMASHLYENVRLLLLCKSKAYPNGLSNNHGQVGKHYFSHNEIGAVSALFPFNLHNWYGTVSQGVAIDDWADDNFDHSGLDFIGGGNLWFAGERRPIASVDGLQTWLKGRRDWGSAWKSFVKENADRTNNAHVQKTTLPYEDNYLDLDPEVKDPLGVPVIRITAEFKENEKKIAIFTQGKIGFVQGSGRHRDRESGCRWIHAHGRRGSCLRWNAHGGQSGNECRQPLELFTRSAESGHPRRRRVRHERRPQSNADDPGAGLADRRVPRQELEVHLLIRRTWRSPPD